MIRKKILIFIILVVFIVSLAVVLYIFNIKTQDKGNIISTNKSEKIKEDHCLETLCLINTKINYNNKYKIGEIEFDIKNISNKKIAPGFIKMVDKNNPKISFVIYHLELPPKTEQQSFIQFTDRNIINITDYKLEKLTDKETKQAIKNLNP